MIHPYMDGNKRTSRLLANTVLHRLNMSIIEWDFTEEELRNKYQLRFGRALMSGNLASCLDLHKGLSGYPKFTESSESEYYEKFAVILFGERGAVH